MKIKVDRENKAVVAYGFYLGKRIKAVAVCKESYFDESFGVELATKKYKIKKRYIKMMMYESKIKELNKQKEHADLLLKEYNRIVEGIDSKIMKDSYECECFVNKYFEKKGEK